MTGHLLGAAGGLEAVISVLAIHDSVVPPTINLENPDEAANGFDLVPHIARQKKVRVALSNSFGFGGTNVALVFKRHD
jgi:3-oxoacyl-[acyl-carrier-protein] synthase II